MSKTELVRFDRNRYSVMAKAVGRPVEIQACPDGVVLQASSPADNTLPKGSLNDFARDLIPL